MTIVDALASLPIDASVFWVFVTVFVFWVSQCLSGRFNGTPLLHPVILSVTVLMILLLVFDVEYQAYFSSVSVIHMLLAPAIVALAIPLFDNLKHVRSLIWLFIFVSSVGAILAVLTAVGIGYLFGFDLQVLLTLSTKSVTTPIALGIADAIGAYGSLAAGLVLVTGAIGCILLPLTCRIVGENDDALKGLVLGVTAHAMGTAFAFRYGMLAGALSGLVMGVAGSITAFLLPLMVSLLGV